MAGEATAELHDVDVVTVERVVGSRSFERGQVYARRGRVLGVEWDAETAVLTGSVVGQGALYETAAFFAGHRDGPLALADGECTCPVGFNCKHVAALVLAAGGSARRGGPGVVPSRRVAHKRPEPASWEAPLRALIGAPGAGATGSPLAIELALHATGLSGGGATRLMARLMRPGARGGWVNGSLAWNRLESWELRGGDHRQDHLALVRDIAALQRARDRRSSSFYVSGADKTLDLTDCGAQLWPLLDEAARVGLPLIHAGRGRGELPRHVAGEVVLDVTRADYGERLIGARLDVEGAPGGLRPVLFLGAEGHGAVCADVVGGSGDFSRWRLQLVRLARPAAAQLQRLVLDGESLTIPEREVDRFATEICPSLRAVARVVSSDESFTAPEVSAPALLLRVRYGEGHTVEVGWSWAYRVGADRQHVPLLVNGGGRGFRDLDAESEILAAVRLVGTGLEGLGLVDGSGRPAGMPVSLSGRDTMRFTTEHLPALRELRGVDVEVDGEPADYRDVAGTLEIGVSTADIAGERDWFDLGVTISVEGRELPFAEVFAALAGGESDMLLDDGAHFSLLEPRLQQLRALIEEARALADAPTGSLRVSRYQAGFWAELAALGVVGEQAQAWRQQIGALLDLDELPEHAPSSALKTELRPYQRDGFAWLASLLDLGLGGILADDMGLGKTLQALALICHARERPHGDGPFLVVAPTSVVSNWVAEAARFTPDLRVQAATDTLAKAGRTIDELAAADVVVTTYTLLRLDADAYAGVEWAGVILDEAQFVKNHQAKTYRCVRQLRAPSKLALTGTPMENNLMELWALLSITAPGLFPDPKRFAEHWQRPIERGGDGERLERLRRRIKPLVKRRTKELVAADLPAKQEQALEVDLHPRHRRVYETHLQRERQRILGLLGDFDRNRLTILRSITLLRQLSLHAALIEQRSDAVPCAKLDALVEQLGDVIGGGHRALVFSQFTGFLSRVRDRLTGERIGCCYLDGSTRRRDRVIDEFRDGDSPVFLISLKAGGFGLNLTEADYCFLMDPWWNPATENQAIDRTHRIGQTRPVMVYRLIARNTIEEKVVALARRKAALFKGVMDDGGVFATGITADDIRGLLA